MSNGTQTKPKEHEYTVALAEEVVRILNKIASSLISGPVGIGAPPGLPVPSSPQMTQLGKYILENSSKIKSRLVRVEK